MSPAIRGLLRSPRSIRGDVPPLFRELGQTATLPTTLGNAYVRLQFAADATSGVVLQSMQDLEVSEITGLPFTWTFAAAPLWRLVVNEPSDAGDDAGDDAGGGGVEMWPTADVLVSIEANGDAGDDAGDDAVDTTRDGTSYITFRWVGLERPDGGTFDVTAIVSLGPTDREARWWIGVRRDTDGDGIEYVEFPRLSVVAPVSSTLTRVMLAVISPPPVGAINASLAAWAGKPELETHYPTGEAGTLSQQFELEAIACTDPAHASVNRVLLLSTDDRVGWHKRWVRSATSTVFTWAHRFFPRWARHPAAGLESASEAGTVFYSQYRVTVAPLLSPQAAWCNHAAEYYRARRETGVGPEALPKLADESRSDLARGERMVVAVRGHMGVDGITAGSIVAAAAEDLRLIADAPKALAIVSDLAPALDVALPNLVGGFARLRGTNYHIMCPTWSHNLHLGWLPMQDESAARPVDPTDGFFHPAILNAELDAMADVGFNNIRIRGSWLAWCIDPIGYMRTLKLFCAGCAARGMGVTYTTWTSTPAGYAAGVGLDARTLLFSQLYDGAATRALLWDLSEQWQVWAVTGTNGAPTGMPAGEVDLTHWPEPMNGATWNTLGRFGQWSDPDAQRLARDYMVAIARFFADDADGRAAYHSTDLYNEPGTLKTAFAVGDPRRERVRQNVNDFIAQSYRIMREHHPEMQAVIDGGDGEDELAAHRAGVTLSYFCGHAYNFATDPVQHEAAWQGIAQAVVNGVAAAAQVSGVGPAAILPFVVSEFYVRPECSGEMHRHLDPMIAAGAGGQSWSYLKNAAWRKGGKPFDGLVQCSTRPLNVTTSTVLAYPVVEPVDDAAIRAWVLT